MKAEIRIYRLILIFWSKSQMPSVHTIIIIIIINHKEEYEFYTVAHLYQYYLFIYNTQKIQFSSNDSLKRAGSWEQFIFVWLVNEMFSWTDSNDSFLKKEPTHENISFLSDLWMNCSHEPIRMIHLKQEPTHENNSFTSQDKTTRSSRKVLWNESKPLIWQKSSLNQTG